MICLLFKDVDVSLIIWLFNLLVFLLIFKLVLFDECNLMIFVSLLFGW